MEPERWRRAEQIFDAALDVDTGERRDFVTASCAADPDLADEVLQMLAADRRLDGGLSTARAGEDADFLAKAVLGGQSLLSQGDLEALGSPPPVESPSTGDPGALDPGALDSGALDPGVLDPGSLDPGSLDAEAAELDAEGRAFGKYRLLEKIGAGGFGQVYRASDAVLGREVAIKTCTSADPRLRQRFLREAKISAALQHPNIVTVFDFGFRDGVPFLVQELLPGEDLSQPIARRLSLPVETVEGILLDIARGLAHAHDQGVLHRDVKPGNVRLLPDGTVKLLDFGIARLRDHKSGITSEGVTLGTVGYLAPEQLSGRNEDERSDIFAFGVLAYELLCFEKPFVGETFSQVSYQLLFEAPPPLRDRTDGVRGPVLSTVDRCLQKSPEDRHASFHDVIRALESEVAAPPDAASALSEPAASEPAARRRGPDRRLWAVPAAVAASALAWLLVTSPDPKPPADAGPVAAASPVPSAADPPPPAAPPEKAEAGPVGPEPGTPTSISQAPSPASPGAPAPSPEASAPEPATVDLADRGTSTPPRGAPASGSQDHSADVDRASGSTADPAVGDAPAAEGGGVDVGASAEPAVVDVASEPATPGRSAGEAVAAGGPAAPVSVEMGEVPPVLIERAEPDYPPLARQRRREATVVVSAFVSATGAVERTLVQHSSALGLGFEAAAVDAARRCRFEPGRRGGEPAGFWQELSFEFTLR